jgi:uncharacterized protein (TIGR03067 family)
MRQYAVAFFVFLSLPAVPVPAAEVLSGTWVVVAAEQDGKPFKFPPKGTRYTFAGGKVTVGAKKGEGKVVYTFRADPKKNPTEVDLFREEGGRKVTLRGIYRIEKDRLVLCLGVASPSGEDGKVIEGKRPAAFKSGPRIHMVTFEREKS